MSVERANTELCLEGHHKERSSELAMYQKVLQRIALAHLLISKYPNHLNPKELHLEDMG